MTMADQTRAALRAALDAHQPVWVDPPVLQPAGVYLELSGDEIRRRAFLVDDGGHDALCLRPDMTVPAVRAAYALPTLPAVVAYEGAVFRREEDESEFVQIGAEWLGAGAMDVAGEAEIVAAALAACRAADVEPSLKLGDAGLIAGFVDALGLDDPWPQRVRRALSRPGGLAALRAEKHTPDEEGAGLAEAMSALPADHAEGALLDLLDRAGITAVGGRPLGEIAERLRQRGKLASAPPPSPAQFDLLDALTHIDAADGADQAAALTRNKALKTPARAEAALDRARQRIAALQKLARLPGAFTFAPGLGRMLAYYDGFVFELEAPSGVSIGGGGRYDGLARALWPADKKAPVGLRAAGFALRSARMNAVRP